MKNLKVPIKVISKKKFDFIQIEGQHNFKSFDYKVPGDISSCSFFLVLTLLSKNSQLTIKNININKSRMGIIKILNKMNANITFKNQTIYKGEVISDIVVKSKQNLKCINCPENLNSSAIDEFLIIFLVAAKAKGISVFKNLGELNKKESPRLDISVEFLKKIGVKVTRKKDDIKIFGNPNLKLEKRYVIKNFRKDHRVFMMSCIAALTLGGNWKIDDKSSINSSFPNFLKNIKKTRCKNKLKKKRKNLITVAIDSPAAAGAGTQAKYIANEYKLLYLDTGKIYRFIGKLRLNNKNNFNYKLVREKIKKINLEKLKDKSLISNEIAISASIVAKDYKLRKIIKKFQLECAYNPPKKFFGSVLDGRDITSVIMKNAMFKFYITANIKIRARRRYLEFKKLNKKIDYKFVLKSLRKRDYLDKNRKFSPLKKTKDSILINTSKLSKKACFIKIKSIMDKKIKI